MLHRVLIVDDDQLIRNGLATLLEKDGHEAITAETVTEGLDKLSSWPTHVLLDTYLPDGVGTMVLRHIRTKKMPIKVAVLSESLNTELIAEAHALQADAVFRKPEEWNALLDWLATA